MGEYNERTLALTKRWDIGQFSGVWLTWILRWINSLKDYVIEHFQKYTHKGAIPLIHNISRSNAEALETVIINLKKRDTDLKD